MSTTTAVEQDEWVRRIGPEAAKLRRQRGKLIVWAWCLLPVGVAIYVAFIAIIVGAASRRSGVDIGMVLLLVFLGAFAFLGVVFCAALASSSRLRMEGAAWRVLQPQVPGIIAYELGRQLRSASRFDRWAREHGVIAPASSPDGVPDPSRVVAPWSPDTTRRILPGPTAQGVSRVTVFPLAGFLVLCLCGSILGLNGIRGVLGASVFAAGALCLLAAGVCAVWGLARRGTEYRHGYITAVSKTRSGSIVDVRTGADLVDPKTGVVIRAAGAPAITSPTYRERIRAIRAAHPGTKGERLR
ncbi:hypothetical protein [Microbacterium panaciterrae]|uniref:PH domain-containing protein n=1 Tax=Microbacterium panaciterrae TaxID=985759 RepID=A0ABP8PE13_9MICO